MSLVELHGGSGSPVYLVHGLDGLVFGYRELSASLGRARRCVAVESRGVDREREPLDCVEAIAAAYIDDISRAGAPDRWLLSGWSFGGIVAFEMGAQLARAGARVAVAVLDSRGLVDRCDDAEPAEEVDQSGLARADRWVVERLRATRAAHAKALARYRPSRSRAPLLVVRAAAAAGSADPSLGFTALTDAPVEACAFPTGHEALLRSPHVGAVAERIEAFFARQERA